jgi:GAF domain-containing protein
VYRQEVRPFTDRQIALVTNFAAQAVIAIENTRLLSELRQRTNDLTERTADLTEALKQQTATSEVLQVISSSPGDLQPVFEAMLENATRVCEAKFGILMLAEGEAFRLGAIHNAPQAFAEFMQRGPVRPNPHITFGRAVTTKRVAQTADITIEQPYLQGDPLAVAAAELGGYRTVLAVPMLKENGIIGALVFFRQEVRTFDDKQIALVQNFAAQAVIAIENARLLSELRESLEQQTATSQVLQVISSSPGDLSPVFEAMLNNATRICEAKFGILWLSEKEGFRCGALHNAPLAFAEQFRSQPLVHPVPGAGLSKLAETRHVVQIADMAALQAYREQRVPTIVAAVELGGVRTAVHVPMLKENVLVGAITVFRQEVRKFEEKQIELLENFAKQAVIAIENTRLLNELRESLQQQTATADVLKVISRSTFDLQTVLDTLVESAAQLCVADKGAINMRDGQVYRTRANYGYAREALQYAVAHPAQVDRSSLTGRVALEGKAIHIRDVLADPEYRAIGYQQAIGYKTALGVPLLRQGTTIGVLFLSRDEVNPFTEKQIELVNTFADQAVIAIENVRLFEAEQQRTRELAESLEQQTATSKVLDVISRSAFDLQAVFETVAESSVRLCGADRAFIYRFDGEMLRMAVAYNTPPEFKEFVERNPIRPGRHSCAARAALERRTIHIPDILADPEYTFGARAFFPAESSTVLGVPILKGDDILGVMIIYHQEVRPFTDNQITLVETFADQAAIAIENVRLLDELRQRTDELGRSVEELRALGEVSQAVNSTLELETVLSTIVANAVQLSDTEAGAIYVFDDQQREFRLRATYGMDRELIDALVHADMSINEANIALILAERDVRQVADLRDEATNEINEITLRAGFRARLIAPLMRREDVVGLLVVRRRAPGTFQQNTIDLIKTFAAQSAVAIENARLFQSVQTSLEDLRTAQDRLVQTQKLASLGQLTAGIAHEIKNPLNFVNNFSGVSAELIDELQETLGKAKVDPNTLAEITELTNTLHDNLDKIVQHGKRADAIVKNMLLHSREGSGEHRMVEANALVEESLNLAYHGARAEKPGFKINMERSFDPAVGKIDVFPQEITRALLNLISNGFYAATKRKEQNDSDGYEPTLTASTKNLGDKVEIRIRDNGTGVPPEAKEKMFNPFFTTKTAGEGTGLGLSITHDIIVKQHTGSIEVNTQPGEFTEIRIVLPRTAAFTA